MTRDRSLDEFVGGGGGTDDADTESDADENADAVAGDGVTDADEGENESVESAEGGADRTDGAEGGADRGNDAEDVVALSDEADVDPATPTYRWTPEGAACDWCGRIVERRWVDDGDDDDAFVCDDCKEW